MKFQIIFSVKEIRSFLMLFAFICRLFEPVHGKTYKNCATGEDSNHPRSLNRVFTDLMCLLQHPGYPKRDKREPLPR